MRVKLDKELWVTREQIGRLDYLNIQAGVDIARMMELAGLQVSRLAEHFRPTNIICLAGGGHNGGDSLCAARHLLNKGYGVTAVLASLKVKEEVQHQRRVFEEAGGEVIEPETIRSLKRFDLIVDGLLGYNVDGDPRGEYARLIELANGSGKPILAVDLPSGLNADGEEYTLCIQARRTLCLGYPKKGCLENRRAGEVWVGYIGILPSKARELGVKPFPFKGKELLRVK